MPLYEFEHLETKEITQFFFNFQNVPPFGSLVEIEGQQYKRVITRAPCGIVKETINPFSSEQFVDRSARKKGTIGDLLDESRELGEKRKKDSPDGRDKKQDGYFDSWSERRAGKQHPADDRPKKPTKLKVKK